MNCVKKYISPVCLSRAINDSDLYNWMIPFLNFFSQTTGLLKRAEGGSAIIRRKKTNWVINLAIIIRVAQRKVALSIISLRTKFVPANILKYRTRVMNSLEQDRIKIIKHNY